MAKSFKDLPLSGRAVPKPIAGRDFFDLTQEVNQPALSSPTPTTTPLASKPVERVEELSPGSEQTSEASSVTAQKPAAPSTTRRKPSKKSKAGTSGNTPLPEVPALPAATRPVVVDEPFRNRNVRQTFVVSEHHLERVRDYVHARRSQGDYLYSQKQALQEAIDFFLDSKSPAPPRPAELRKREQQFRTRIQEGRQASARSGQTADSGKSALPTDDSNPATGANGTPG